MSTESPIDCKKYKKLLLKIQRDLLAIKSTANKAAQTVELDQSRIGRLSRMDAMQSQAMSVASQHRRNIKLTKIKTALRRISEEEYGYCLECGKQIADARLTFDPTASLCITCATKAEKSS